MSVWDDSWGACDARGVRGDRGTMVGSGTGRCVNTDPLLAPAASLGTSEEHTVASVHILRSPGDRPETRPRIPRTSDVSIPHPDGAA